MTKPPFKSALFAGLLALTASAGAISFVDPRAARNPALDASAANEPRDPACLEPSLASISGTVPRNPRTLAVRWVGFSNFELVYDGRILLLDAYYDRGSGYPPTGVAAADIRKADVMLLGHGHYDHMSDAASVAARTKAPVVGTPPTMDTLLTQGLPEGQLRRATGRGGEVFRFEGFTVEPILGRHGGPDAAVADLMNPVFRALLPPPGADLRAEDAAIRARGSSDTRIATEGTLAYLITFSSGFRVMYRDSAGAITDFERTAMTRIGRVDLAITALLPSYYFARATAQELEYLRTYRPDVVIPAHHDGGVSGGRDGLWRTTEPVFQAMKDEAPGLVTVSPGYREPVCFNTAFNLSARSAR